ncbi:hypothetical protein E2I00_009910, partial [Balaenoptera physalus]
MAAAKVDELTKQLESLWSDSPAAPLGSQARAPARLSRYSLSPVPEPLGSRGSPRKATTDGADTSFRRSESAPAQLPYSSLSPKGRPSTRCLRAACFTRPAADNVTSATLPRNYKVFPLANDRRSDVDSYRRSLGSAGAMLPGSPIFSRAPPPKLLLQPQLPPQSQPQLQLQALAPVPQPPQETWSPVSEGLPKPPTELEPEPELEGLLTSGLEAGDADEDAVTRPLSPTRLQPALPPEAQSVPELEEVARVLAEIPRPLKRRGSMEQSPIVALPPTHKKQYQQIINRLFHRHGGPGRPEPELCPIAEGPEARAGPPAPAPPAPIPPLALLQSSPPEQPQSMEMRSVLRKAGSPRKVRRARLSPLVLLLDAALTGELDVVQQAKCDPYREGYTDCATYLADVEQSMGLMYNGVVYALWDYSAEFGDELSFRDGESVTVLRRDGPEETDWWWAALHGQEGYVPRNYF